MDTDRPAEGRDGQDPPRPPCVPASPRPRAEAFPGVPRRSGVRVSCPVPPSARPKEKAPLEVLLREFHSLQKVHRAAVQELAEAQECREGLCQQLERLEQGEKALQDTQQGVQEALQRAQLRRKEVEAKGQRSCGLCREQQQDLEGTEQQLEQLQHLRRGHRLQYCQQLEAITEQLKQLRSTHAPEHLEAELMHLETMEEKWLSLERRVTDTEQRLGPEAPELWRLVQQELERAERQLEEELGRQRLSRERRERLAEELRRPLEAPPE